jgi:hypothetical protein
VLDQEIVEASYEDDLWGAFDIEEVPKSVTAETSNAFGVLEPDSEFEAEEFFSFEDESETIEETGPALDLGFAVDEPVVKQSAEEMFSFAEEPSPVPAAEQLPEYEPFSFEPEEAPAVTAPVEPVKVPVEPVKAPIPALEPQSAPLGLVAQTSAAQPAAFTLSEEELVAALSRISKEVIERIVWEVVPDLAEVLIKEEIRKLRSGIRG